MAFALLAGLAVMVSGSALLSLNRADARFQAVLQGVAMRERLASDIAAAAQRRAIAARNLALDSQDSDGTRAREKALVESHQADLNAALVELRRALQFSRDTDGRLAARVERVAAVEARYAPVAAQIVVLALAGRHGEAAAMINRDCRPLLVELQQATAELVRHERAEQVRLAAESAAANARDRQRLGLGAAAAALAALWLSWRLSRDVTRPLRRAVGAAEAVAKGDLAADVRVDRHDETGQLLAALSRMNGNLVEMVTQVRESADGVNEASSQIAAGNLNLSERTGQQSNTLQVTAALMQSMTDAVRHNAVAASQARDVADATAHAAEECGTLVQQVVITMDGISASSARIADIVGVIDGIAFQTNILALNAAVEAARAGEDGRGFAVVAGEVRALAQSSATAAREIKALIGASVEQVDAGAELATRAGSTMFGIVGQVRQVSALVAEIDQSTAAQTAGIGQVNQAVAAIDRDMQHNVALVEQSSAAAESLHAQAGALTQVIARFRIPAQGSPAASDCALA